MTFLYITITVLLLLLFISGFVIFNLLKKNEVYETAIEQFYSQTTFVLYTMRVLDAKQMFESDDEVGSLFAQLKDIIFTLQQFIQKEDDDKEEN